VQDFIAIANLGGLGAFSAIVYFELRRFREVFEARVVTIQVKPNEATENE
jgi:hypothetical protein